jgi:TonB family protein
MPQPKSYGTPTPEDKKEKEPSRHGDDTVSAEASREVLEVARTLAAHGGGAASFDLALDLVLNEVVEKARAATGATGAAIALARAGEMVCRATSGKDAPELGVRLETASGLSGECLQSGTIQQCSDTETDLRVNAEACRQLGVRSILVLPLNDENIPVGIMEVFSSRPNAFSDRDVIALRVLASRVVDNMREAEDMSATVPTPEKSPTALFDEVKVTSNTSSDYETLWENDLPDSIDDRSQRRTEVLTNVLSVLVIVFAMLLGLALGWRAASHRGRRSVEQARTGASSAQNAGQVTNAGGEQATVGVPDGRSAGKNPSMAQKRAGPEAVAEPPSGGLQVTQNGKVIYRSPPAEQQNADPRPAFDPSGDISATRLIHRVEPEYPADARDKHVQGAVTLDVQIGGNGAVRSVAVLEGNPVLGEAAIAAVRQWRYRPYSVDGHPVEMQTRVTIRFSLPPT